MNYLGCASVNDSVDYEYNNRKNKIRNTCPMRHENGNCLAVGGFCTAVNDEICQGLHSAYEMGKTSVGIVEEVRRGEPKLNRGDSAKRYYCPFCYEYLKPENHYCPNCGAKMDKETR